ncbi:MAG: hypothetical protein KC441_11005 [Anaerolineales bacterium]|nr:hypothetical protein [Anaerolineales bacterium]
MNGYEMHNIRSLLNETFSREELVAHAYTMTFWFNDPDILLANKETLTAALVDHAAWRSEIYPYSLIDELLHWARMKGGTAVYEKFEPYYPAGGPHTGRAYNLAALCCRLADTLSVYELLGLAADLGFDGRVFGLDNGALRTAAIIAFVDRCDKEQCLPALFRACERMRPSLAEGLEIAAGE